MKIKASQITNLTDARYFAAREVHWMSFDFREKSSNFIDPIKARAIFEWVEVPTIIGEFDNISADEIRFYTEGWGLKAIQVSFFTPLETVKALQGFSIIKEIWIEEFTNSDVLRKTILEFLEYVDAFQLNFEHGDISFADIQEGRAMISLEELKAICLDYPIILDISFSLQDINAIKMLNLAGLSMKGSAEERVGVKTFDELDDIFDTIEESFA